MASQNGELLSYLRQQSESLHKLERRTEFLSPSKIRDSERLRKDPLPASPRFNPALPVFRHINNHLIPYSIEEPATYCSPASDHTLVTPPPSSSLSSPQFASSQLPPTSAPNPFAAAANSPAYLNQILSSELEVPGPPPQQLHVGKPILIQHESKFYYVLPLTLESGRLILPQPAAFYLPPSPPVPDFPAFNSNNMNWKSILEMVKQRTLCWPVWAPRSLGSYKSVDEIWKEWSEGNVVKGVGRSPPLRLVEELWGAGGQVGEPKKTGTRQTWRPADEKTRKTWSNFMFFVQQVHVRQRQEGITSMDAIALLEQQRTEPGLKLKRSLPKLREHIIAISPSNRGT